MSSLYSDNSEGSLIFSKSLQEFLEVLIVDDKMLYHSASPVKQILPDNMAYRDLLIVSCYELNKQ